MKPDQVVKSFKSKKGNQVVIRYLKTEDMEDLLKFANDLSKEDTFVMLSGEEITRDEEIKYVNDAVEKVEKREKIQLVALVNGTFAGNSVIDRGKRRKNHVGTVSISLAQPFREEGIGTVLLQTLIDEGKNVGLTLLELTCFENNDRALGLYEKVGFKRVGVIPNMYAYKGKHIGEVILYLPLV